MKTKVEDWLVIITGRSDADYSERIELLSFEFSFRGSALSRLDNVPFERGVQEADLRVWLTNVPASVEDSPGVLGSST